MKLKSTLFFTCLLSLTNLYASNSQYCEQIKDPTFAKKKALESKNLISFYNEGGIANGGVCWWHSRLQRSALYLTYFSPEKAKPTTEEVKKILKKLKTNKSVVEIPGFENFNKFTWAYRETIQNFLENWQMQDGVLRFSWVNGLRGTTEIDSDRLQKKMDELYQMVAVEHDITYQKLQMDGIKAHSWLVIDMEKIEGGYKVRYIDSGFPTRSSTYKYQYGDSDLNLLLYGGLVPYSQKERDIKAIKKAQKAFCDK